jgi:sulfite exporter TauE/SafE
MHAFDSLSREAGHVPGMVRRCLPCCAAALTWIKVRHGGMRSDAPMHWSATASGLLDALSALCGPAALERGLFLVPALLLAGLAGSVVHCTAMCGPFVLGQVADGMARIPAARMCQAARLRGAALLPYHAGRLATYAALGTASGWIGGLPLPQVVPAALLAIAASGFLLLALRRLQPGFAFAGPTIPSGPGWGHRLAAMAGRIGQGRGRGLKLGLALGLLPCGLVYAALAAASASGPLLGGLGMLAFGLGTVPALVVVGVLGHAVAQRWQSAANRAAPWVLAGNGLLLLALAWRALAA